MHNSIAKITQEKNEMFPISYMSKLEQNNETNIFLLEKFRLCVSLLWITFGCLG